MPAEYNPKKFEWQLRFFVSVDLIGSTAYKSSFTGKRDAACDWSDDFREFLENFSGSIEYDAEDKPENILSVWKYLGDEVLLSAKITDSMDVFRYLRGVSTALLRQDSTFKTKSIPLRCKACAWIAGFPLKNTIILGNQDDYLGPQIDLGFRLSKFATKRKFVISLECAYILAKSTSMKQAHEPQHQETLAIFFHGKEILKGVNGDEPYPIFWLDNGASDTEIIEDTWGKREKIADSVQVSRYALSFFANNKYFNDPFIENDISQILHKIPQEQIHTRDIKIKKLTTTEDQFENKPCESPCDQPVPEPNSIPSDLSQPFISALSDTSVANISPAALTTSDDVKPVTS